MSVAEVDVDRAARIAAARLDLLMFREEVSHRGEPGFSAEHLCVEAKRLDKLYGLEIGHRYCDHQNGIPAWVKLWDGGSASPSSPTGVGAKSTPESADRG